MEVKMETMKGTKTKMTKKNKISPSTELITCYMNNYNDKQGA